MGSLYLDQRAGIPIFHLNVVLRGGLLQHYISNILLVAQHFVNYLTILLGFSVGETRFAAQVLLQFCLNCILWDRAHYIGLLRAKHTSSILLACVVIAYTPLWKFLCRPRLICSLLIVFILFFPFELMIQKKHRPKAVLKTKTFHYSRDIPLDSHAKKWVSMTQTPVIFDRMISCKGKKQVDTTSSYWIRFINLSWWNSPDSIPPAQNVSYPKGTPDVELRSTH